MTDQPGGSPIPNTAPGVYVAPNPYWTAPPPSRGVSTTVAVLIGVGCLAIGVLLSLVVPFLFFMGFGGAFGMLEDFEEDMGGGFGYSAIKGFSPQVGDCYEANIDMADLTIEELGRKVSCQDDHDIEVFASVETPLSKDAEYSNTDLGYFGDGACALMVKGFTGKGYDHSDFEVAPILPTNHEWKSGERTIDCVLFDYDGGSLEESMKDSKRD